MGHNLPSPMTESDLVLIEKASAVAQIAVVRYAVRGQQAIHQIGNNGRTTYWNPLNPATGHIFELLDALAFVGREVRIRVGPENLIEGPRKTASSATMQGSTPVVVETPSSDGQAFCRTVVECAAQFFDSNRNSDA